MLFNSYQFLLMFLPITLFLYFLAYRFWGNAVAIFILILASLFFYSWWNPIYFFLIIFSILINFITSNIIFKYNQKLFLIFGIIFNLGLIGYFKYLNFFIDVISFTSNLEFITKQVILPLGISFYTFQQITFIVDVYNKKVNDLSFRNYIIFVTFFPQLIAGPIVHHSQILHQFKNNLYLEKTIHYLSIGFSIFAIGLFKKVIIADNLSAYSSPIFFAAEHSMSLSFLEVWSGLLCYSFQLYFDFSGYSDMAIGLGYMFGIKLPINFNSPFKSTNIADFWRSWHITLGIFIRNYVYYPMSIFFTRFAMSKKRNLIINFMLTIAVPTFLTYLLLGMWHGSGINFILFGALHGMYIIIYSVLKKFEIGFFKKIFKNYIFTTYVISCFFVFILFSISLVFFRAPTFESAILIYKAMININNIIIPESWFLIIQSTLGNYFFDLMSIHYGPINFFYGLNQLAIIFILLLFCIFGPNTMNLFHNYFPSIDKVENKGIILFNIKWQPNIIWSCIISLLFTYTFMSLSNISEFIYFQF